MLTKVILEGPMGKAFGREWAFQIDSPAEALRMIDANKPGVFTWIRANLKKYSTYKVICEYGNGRSEELDKDSYQLAGKPTKIRFVPLIEGAGASGKLILGLVLVVAGAIFEQPWMMKIGATMMVSGFIEALSARPSKTDSSGAQVNSHYFDGPTSNTTQGSPVPLIYGRILVGSHAISAAVTVDQLM